MFETSLMSGQRILVTGGGTGLGRAMAERFLGLGADVAICGRRQAVCEVRHQASSECRFAAGGQQARRLLSRCDAGRRWRSQPRDRQHRQIIAWVPATPVATSHPPVRPVDRYTS